GLCAKCGLKDKDAKKCQNAVVVTKDGKKTTYYLAGKLSDDAHKSLGFCNASKDEPVKVEVTGTCEKKGDKLVLTPTEKIKKIAWRPPVGAPVPRSSGLANRFR